MARGTDTKKSIPAGTVHRRGFDQMKKNRVSDKSRLHIALKMIQM